jgi:saccharopine dehydrogenase-like NADP-dependent oxidoreductase
MKRILLFGAGKSATCLIEYLLKQLKQNDWYLIVCDADIVLATSKIGNAENASAVSINVENEHERRKLVEAADIVISMLPPTLHFLIAKDCISYNKNLLTASYIDDSIKSLEKEISSKKLLFLCEMGLDPGIDHMSAMKMISTIKDHGGLITSFKSHCGGLIAPESDDNPWHYKITWNPRNIVLAGKNGAEYKLNDKKVHENYEELFKPERVTEIKELGYLSYYPNRDSLAYMNLYKLTDASTFMRTTLRYPEFCYGWKNIIDLKLTDETIEYDTNGMTLKEFFKIHFDKHNFSEWLMKNMSERFAFTKDLLEKLVKLQEAEEELQYEAQEDDAPAETVDNFMMVDDEGELKNVALDDIKNNAANAVMIKLHEANLSLKQLFYLGMDSNDLINKGRCSSADVLQFALEKKLALIPGDKDMIVMQHEIEYKTGGSKYEVKSSLIVKGEDSLKTAMAKTVGLPLGIAAKLILQNKIKISGLHIPVIPEIYEPVLNELEKNGIKFTEETSSKQNTF